MHWRGKQALIVLVMIVAVGGLLQTPLLARVRGMAWSAWTSFIVRVAGLSRDDAEQQPRLERLLAENIRLQAELDDYRQLRQQLGTPAFADFRAVGAAVVGQPIDTFRSELLLSRGARDGLNVGAPVVFQGSILIGFITKLNDDTAVCQLLLHPSSTLTAHVLENGDVVTHGLVEGRHYTALALTTVPRDQTLHSGQVVVTTAKPNQVPFGLVIGTIDTISSSASETYQAARLHLSYDPDTIRAVSVLTPL